MVTAEQVAEYFLHLVDRDAGDSMTNLRLQKLVYYTQAWHLAVTGQPLFGDDFQAWIHGPVIPELYRRYRTHGWDPIPAKELDEWEALSYHSDPSNDIDSVAKSVIEDVWGYYGSYSAKGLEALTHQESPWQDARRDLSDDARCTTIISKGSMHSYYAALLHTYSAPFGRTPLVFRALARADEDREPGVRAFFRDADLTEEEARELTWRLEHPAAGPNRVPRPLPISDRTLLD